MKATVFVEGEAVEPCTVDHNMETGVNDAPSPLAELLDDMGLNIEDYDIVSAYSLNVAIWTLQTIARVSRCHHSRVVARSGLRMIGDTTDVDTDEEGMPVAVPAPIPSDQVSYEEHWTKE